MFVKKITRLYDTHLDNGAVINIPETTPACYAESQEAA